MKKRSLLYFIITSFTILLLSCSNILQQKTSDIAFKLGDDVVSKISKTINNSVTDSSPIKLQCEFRGIKLKSQSTEIKLSELKTATMVLTDIPYGKEFNILLKIYFNSAVIYQGESNKIILDKDNDGQTVNINISEKRGSYTLDYNGADDIPADFPENTPKEYYYDTPEFPLPENIYKQRYDFLGWYANFNTPNELKVTKLGKSNYLGDVTLKAKWITEIYGSISEAGPISIIPGDRKLTLYWENPQYEDFDHVNIYRQASSEDTTLVKLAQITGKPGELASYEVTDLTNSVENLFVIKTVNKAGDESLGWDPVSGTSGELVPEEAKHNTVEVLPANTSGTYGTNGLYVTFGDYPQTVATADEEKSINKTELYIFNNMPCYKDKAGNYYVKLETRPCSNSSSLKEYRDSTPIPDSYNSFNYFKIEPIKWRVLDRRYVDKSGANKGILLFAEDVLVNSQFATENNKYAESKIRGFLNNGITKIVEKIRNPGFGPGEDRNREEEHKEIFKSSGFSNWAFSDSALTNTVQSVRISDSADKVFLLSIDELSNNYGFPNSDLSLQGIKVPARQRVPTDYARAKGAFVANNGDETDWWWTRDVGFTTGSYSQPVKVVGCEGNINLDISYYERDGGVVPAIVVSSNSISNIDFKPGYIVNFDGYYDIANGKIVLKWDDSTYDNYTNIVIKEKGGSFTKTVAKGVNTLTITGVPYDGVEHIYTAQTAGDVGSSDIIECKVKASELGYVVLKDGTKKHYKSLAESEKANAIAVIFGKVDTKFIGMALQEKTGDPYGGFDGHKWSINNKIFENLICNISSDKRTVTGGYTNGEDSWVKICAADNTAAEHPENYPAYKYANEYGTLLPAGTDTSLIGGWYVPTMKDIVDIYNNLAVVNNAVSYVNGTPITSWYWWSCNQIAGKAGGAYQFSHMGGKPGEICDGVKTETNTVRCVKQFE